MKRILLTVLVAAFVLSSYGLSFATNGDNLIAVGPIARSMGGVGIAAPQDAISAVFSNPAAMCFGPYCPGSEVNFGGSVFMPDAHAQVISPAGNTGNQKSHSDLFLIPAIGISSPITPDLRFGLAAYGVSGLGVDYRDNPVQTYTNFQSMKFAPNLAYMISPNFSIGAAVQIVYGALDLGQGTSTGYTVGGQFGAIYKTGPLSLGATYTTPQQIKYNSVSTFNGFAPGGALHYLKLESPQVAGIGVAYEPIPNVLLVEVDGKWINWGDAKGYDDFNWQDQWVGAVGVQYKPTPQLALRVGYNFANNPIKTDTITPAGTHNVQGVTMPDFVYEYFRVTGFPALVTQHATLGIGYQVSKKISVEVGYMHAFKKHMTENGTGTFPDGMGGYVQAPASITSSLSEDSIDFGITWRF
jgi:long-chain fatty acid transport protein